MSRQTIYKCDGCGKATGDKIHISLIVANHAGTGIAVPPDKPKGRSQWGVYGLDGNFFHFHNGVCIAKYFDRKIAKVKATSWLTAW